MYERLFWERDLILIKAMSKCTLFWLMSLGVRRLKAPKYNYVEVSSTCLLSYRKLLHSITVTDMQLQFIYAMSKVQFGMLPFCFYFSKTLQQRSQNTNWTFDDIMHIF